MVLVLLKYESSHIQYEASPRNADADVPRCLLGWKRQTRVVEEAEIARVRGVRADSGPEGRVGEKWTGSETIALLLHRVVTLFHSPCTRNAFLKSFLIEIYATELNAADIVSACKRLTVSILTFSLLLRKYFGI